MCGFVFAIGACGDTRSLETTASSDDPLALAGTPPPGCTRPMKAATRVRKVVISHPYVDSTGATQKFEVLELHTTGELRKTGTTFTMGKAGYNPIVFTPDGEIGFVTQDDGTIGIFRFDFFGVPHVVNIGLAPGFYPNALVMSPNGDKLYALDPDTTAHGGGVYELDIACDDTVSVKGLVVPGNNANAMTFLPRSRTQALLAGVSAFDSTAGNDTFALDLSNPALTAQGSTFGSAPGIASAIAVTPDGKYGLVTDDSLKAGNRVGVITLESMKPRQILTTDVPIQIVTSIYGNAAMVVNGDSFSQLTMISYNPSNTETPFAVTGPMPYTLPDPVLPGASVQITRGSLKGRVLVAELAAVRQVEFTADGAMKDVSQLAFDRTDDGVIGTIGVEP
jgi:hypothetical protein